MKACMTVLGDRPHYSKLEDNMKDFEEITEFQYYSIIAMFLISIPLVIDAALRMAELAQMVK